MWCIVVLARHSVCNLLSETDSASAALLQVLMRTLCLPVTSVLILVGLLRQLPACTVKILYVAANLRANIRRGGCSTRLQIVLPTTSQSGFGAEPEVSQDGRANCAEEAKDAKE